MNRPHPYILCVDDEEMNLDLLEAYLEDYEITRASDGQQCIDSVAQRRPDIILLDAMMPIMDGKEACKLLKGSADTRNIPVIMLSGRTLKEDIDRMYEAGVDSYLTKPFTEEQLMELIAEYTK